MNHSIESLIVEQGKMSPSPAFAVRQSMIFSGCCFLFCFIYFFIKNRPHAAIKESNNSSRGRFFFF